jgi:hypothetical protein
LKIPTSCCQEDVEKSLKANLEDSFRLAPWFHVSLEGFRTVSWKLSARMDLGGPMMQQSLRDTFRRPVQQAFRDHLSVTEYSSFCNDFNRKGNRLSMQITEDHTPFSCDAPRHSWSLSMNAFLPDGPAAASTLTFLGTPQ